MAHHFAGVAELADALDLGSSVERRASSSLALGTNFFYLTTKFFSGPDLLYRPAPADLRNPGGLTNESDQNARFFRNGSINGFIFCGV